MYKILNMIVIEHHACIPEGLGGNVSIVTLDNSKHQTITVNIKYNGLLT